VQCVELSKHDVGAGSEGGDRFAPPHQRDGWRAKNEQLDPRISQPAFNGLRWPAWAVLVLACARYRQGILWSRTSKV